MLGAHPYVQGSLDSGDLDAARVTGMRARVDATAGVLTVLAVEDDAVAELAAHAQR